MKPEIRTFETGATRDTEEGKYDYEGFLSPLALDRFAAYMHKHRIQPDGTMRDGDNWQKGMSVEVYMKSLFRHLFSLWRAYRGVGGPEDVMDEAAAAMFFNIQGILHELEKSRRKVRDQEESE